MRVGILAYQGGVAEHAFLVRKTLEELELQGEVVPVKKPHQLDGLHVIIIPGGESTTIGKLMHRFGLLEPLKQAIEDGLPVFGTCAGAIMMAKEVSDAVLGRTGQPLLAVMDIEVVRNYYGRQKDSFEVNVKIPALGDEPFRAIFIRAPAIIRAWGSATTLAEHEGVVVAAVQEHMLATTFHPELTGDTRIHRYFLEEIATRA
ncbi:pyridoxal 5'-phosphate synthase glutaminase subunit PdxT [Candidatus Bathyarchaeota archaeon]|nr:MAG: pyridoxal 5'-phosphate synthase glutaminase subunit PdxT [Candidatus Bathyarchaeota archaeon]